MLASGNPPDDWPALLAAAQPPKSLEAFASAGDKPEEPFTQLSAPKPRTSPPG
jgi:hypothetical protein